MTATNIMKCPKCAGLMLAAKRQKTKICPYCGSHVNLQHAKLIASAQTALEASEMLKKLKTHQGFSSSA